MKPLDDSLSTEDVESDDLQENVFQTIKKRLKSIQQSFLFSTLKPQLSVCTFKSFWDKFDQIDEMSDEVR